MRFWLSAVAMLTAAVPGAALAQTQKDDVRCVLAMNILSQQQQAPAELKQFASTALVYFIGRIDGRGGTAQLPTMLQAEAATFNPQVAQTEINRCGTIFKTRGEQMRNLGGPPAGAAKPATPAAPPAKK